MADRPNVESLSRELAEAQQQIATLTSAVAPELATELREWCASVWDGLLDRANLEDSERDSTIEQLAQIVEAHCKAVVVAYAHHAEQAEQQLAEARAEIGRRWAASPMELWQCEKGHLYRVPNDTKAAPCETCNVEAENVRLREALAQIVALDFKKTATGGDDFYSSPSVFMHAHKIAREALAEKEPTNG